MKYARKAHPKIRATYLRASFNRGLNWPIVVVRQVKNYQSQFFERQSRVDFPFNILVEFFIISPTYYISIIALKISFFEVIYC